MASTHINISILVIAKYSVLLLVGTFYTTKIVTTKDKKLQTLNQFTLIPYSTSYMPYLEINYPDQR